MRPIAVSKSKIAQLVKIADWLVIATAVTLPWSTSAVSILLAVWILVLIPTFDVENFRREILNPFGVLPVLLFLLGALGMSWADVSWHDRLGGLDGFVKLLAIPILSVQFSRSDRGKFVYWGFLGSCCLLLVASVIVTIWPNIPRGAYDQGVPVKSYIVQSIEFTICAAALIDKAIHRTGRRRSWSRLALVILAAAFLADIFFVATGRTALVVVAALFVVYGMRHSGWKGAFGAAFVGAAIGAVVWSASPYLRQRVISIYTETQLFLRTDALTSAGERIAFWEKSIRFIEAAPLMGNGTGTITSLFMRAAAGQQGALGKISTNPHNQTFAVGIQLGFIGIAVLWAMWVAQFSRFWSNDFIAWVGLVLVTENVVGSLFNSFIFDFTEGWLYVVGVGVTAGMFARNRTQSTAVCTGLS